jgi:hypothetical protein
MLEFSNKEVQVAGRWQAGQGERDPEIIIKHF